MMCGIEEWNRQAANGHDSYGGNGQWSFRTNAEAIKKYWTACVERMRDEGFAVVHGPIPAAPFKTDGHTHSFLMSGNTRMVLLSSRRCLPFRT